MTEIWFDAGLLFTVGIEEPPAATSFYQVFDEYLFTVTLQPAGQGEGEIWLRTRFDARSKIVEQRILSYEAFGFARGFVLNVRDRGVRGK